jgi:hypothetical protein
LKKILEDYIVCTRNTHKGDLDMGKVSRLLVLVTAGIITLSCSLPTDSTDSNKDVSITSISITSDILTMEEGETKQLNYSVLPSNRTETFYLSTSNKYVVQIDGNGVLSAIAPGTAIIKIYNASNTIFDTCTVTVTSHVYSIGDTITSSGFTSKINRVFYARNSAGVKQVDSSTGANIIVAQVAYTNNTGSSVYVFNSDMALVNNTTQSDATTYSGYIYDPEGNLVVFTSYKSMTTGTAFTQNVAFQGQTFTTTNYKIVNDDSAHPFIVEFVQTEIE